MHDLVKANPPQVIYFSCRGFTPRKVKWYGDAIKVAFINPILVISEAEHSERTHFDTLYECNILIILPEGWYVNNTQLWEIKVMFALKRKVYVITPDNAIVISDELEDFGIHPNTKIKYEKYEQTEEFHD